MSRGIKGPLQESTSLLFEYFGISCPIISKIKTAKDTIKNIYISEGSAFKIYKRERERKDTQKIKSSNEKNVKDKNLMNNKSTLKHKTLKHKHKKKNKKSVVYEYKC